MIVPTWTDERVEKLNTLFDEGLSASQIAFQLGHTTRNAVIGKVCRLGLSRRGLPKKPDAPRAPRNSKNKSSGTIVFRIVEGGFGSRRIIKSVQSEDKVELRCVEVEPLHISLSDLTDKTCHYPSGDGPFTFCGRPTLEKVVGERTIRLPYCIHCAEICYVPAPRNLKGPNYLPTDLAGPILHRHGVRA
jgi:GcrA cell cycle regulator